MRLQIAVCITVIVLLTAARLVAGVDPEATERNWRVVVNGRLASDAAVESLEFSFTNTIQSDTMKVSQVSEESIGLRDGKNYADGKILKSTGLRAGTAFHVAFDGTVTYRRDGEPVLSRSRDPNASHFLSRPDKLLENMTPSQLDQSCASGKAVVRVAEPVVLHGAHCMHVIIAGITWPIIKKAEIWYDMDHGFWPTMAHCYDVGDRARDMSEIDKFYQITINGNRLSYPLRGTRAVYDEHGRIEFSNHIEVEPSSFRINQPIDESKFVILPQPGDRVVDADIAQLAHPRPEAILQARSRGSGAQGILSPGDVGIAGFVCLLAGLAVVLYPRIKRNLVRGRT